MASISESANSRPSDFVGAGPRSERGRVTLQSLGIAFAVPSLLLLPLLARGGLAPMVVAAASALLVGAPAALATWRTRSEPESVRAVPQALRTASTSVAELVGLLLVAAALASLSDTGGAVGLLLAIVAWPASAALVRLPRWVAVPALIGLLGLVGAAVVEAASAPPWTLLEPHWDAWRQYLGPAATAGVLLGGAGTGHWTIGPRRPPGDRHSPWAVVGVGILVTTALVVELGSRYERTLGVPGVGMAALALTGTGLVSTTATLALRSGLGTVPRTLAGLGLTCLLAGPAAGIRPWIGTAVVPLLAALLLAGIAWRASGPDRLVAAGAAAVLAAGAVIAWPGVPETTADAVWIGLVGVGGFWFVATRTLLARRLA